MIKEKLVEKMKKAMKEKNFIQLDTLRLALAEIKNKEIEKREPLSDEEVIQLLKKEVKKREESLVFFEKANRTELIDKARLEITFLQEFLPEQLSTSEVERLVDEVIAQLSENKNFGSVMKEVMARVAGRSDGKHVSTIVRKKLSEG